MWKGHASVSILYRGYRVKRPYRECRKTAMFHGRIGTVCICFEEKDEMGKGRFKELGTQSFFESYLLERAVSADHFLRSWRRSWTGRCSRRSWANCTVGRPRKGDRHTTGSHLLVGDHENL